MCDVAVFSVTTACVIGPIHYWCLPTPVPTLIQILVHCVAGIFAKALGFFYSSQIDVMYMSSWDETKHMFLSCMVTVFIVSVTLCILYSATVEMPVLISILHPADVLFLSMMQSIFTHPIEFLIVDAMEKCSPTLRPYMGPLKQRRSNRYLLISALQHRQIDAMERELTLRENKINRLKRQCELSPQQQGEMMHRVTAEKNLEEMVPELIEKLNRSLDARKKMEAIFKTEVQTLYKEVETLKAQLAAANGRSERARHRSPFPYFARWG